MIACRLTEESRWDVTSVIDTARNGQTRCLDGEQDVVQSKDINVAQPPPALLEELNYNLNLYNNDRWEIVDQDAPIAIDLDMALGSKTIPFTVKVLNNDMLSTNYNPKLPNTPPSLGVQILSQEGRDANILLLAVTRTGTH